MSDLISRQDAIDAISKKQDGVFDQDAEIDTAVFYVYSECKAIIKALPSVQPRKGKWAGKGDSEGFGIFICDNCGKFAMMEYDFCPNCGADMRQGGNSDE